MPRLIFLIAKGAERLLSLVIMCFATAPGIAIFLMAVLMAANVISRQDNVMAPQHIVRLSG